jgi:hypothetical protein
MNQDSLVGIAPRLWTGRLRIRCLIRSREREFSFLHDGQTGCGSHAASYTMGTGSSYPGGVNQQGHEAGHSPASSAKVKNGGAVCTLPHTSSEHGA